MNQKYIGYSLVIISIILIVFVVMAKEREDNYIEMVVAANGGTCFLEDGECLHADRSFVTYIIGGSLAAALLFLGVYLLLFDKSQAQLREHHEKVSSALKEASLKDSFKSYLAGFTEDEARVLSIIHEQEGIKQSTLRYKAGMSKTAVSLMLKDLEKKGVITRKESGKTNSVYLVKKF